MSPGRSIWVWVAKTTPNMAIHRGCISREPGAPETRLELLVAIPYICYVCGGYLPPGGEKITDLEDDFKKLGADVEKAIEKGGSND